MNPQYQNDYWQAFQNWKDLSIKVDELRQRIENAKGAATIYRPNSSDISLMDEQRQAWERLLNIAQSAPAQS